MFNPEAQYRCTIIRGKAQKELDNLLPAYANVISELCPSTKENFDTNFNDKLSNIIYNTNYDQLDSNNQKTIRNHITEIAGKLFGLYYFKENIIYESDNCRKLLEDNDQPAFFKNLCLKFQFPNGTQKIQTILERINDQIKFKPFHFLISLFSSARKINQFITKDEVGYYVLNAKEVLQGLITVEQVLSKIISDRQSNCTKRLEVSSFNTQHIREQLNLLVLANLIFIDGESIILNQRENKTIDIFLRDSIKPIDFDIYSYHLDNDLEKEKMYSDWSIYFSKISVDDESLIATSVESLKRDLVQKVEPIRRGADHTILGDEGEEYVFALEKNRVNVSHPRLTNKVLLVGNQRGLGYDISSVEANENLSEPEFARFIEVKSTKRITEPDLLDSTWVDTINLTRKEWIAAKQYRTAYNIYRVYFTPLNTIVRKINDPFAKNESGLISVLPTIYRMDFSSNSIDKEY